VKKAIAIIVFTFLLVLGLSANNDPGKTRLIAGKVIDKQNGETLAGVKLQVKGSAVYCYTDMDGNFSLQVNTANTTEIVVDMVGYEPSILKANQLSLSADIVLNPR